VFFPKILEQKQSVHSGLIKVVRSGGYNYISTGPLTQSGGIVRELWWDLLKKVGKPNKSWLILGLSGGTIAQIVNKLFPPADITGVEIDPVMIDFGKKYLDLDKIPGLEIVIDDAQHYLSHSAIQPFNYILVDMYLGDKLPEFVYSPDFLKRLKLLSPYIIFNHLFYDYPKRQNAKKLVAELEKIFSHVKLIRKLTNLLIICE
jgi:spermidine synthase